MPILEELLDSETTTGWIRTVSDSLSEQSAELESRFVTMSADVGADPEFVVYSDATPALGIHSVGVIRHQERWQPGLLVTRALAPDSTFDSPMQAGQIRGLMELLTELGGSPPDETWVVGIRPPDEYAETVNGDQEGTLGVPVRLVNGSPGALTAGHVAQSAGDAVEIGGVGPATVEYSSHRHLHGSSDIACADVAVLSFDEAAAFPALSGLGSVAQMRRVAAYNRSGVGGATGEPFRFGGERFPVKEGEGSWGDFMMIDGPISLGGDSGSIAVNEESEVIGQVVGGKPGSYSIVQRITYLLEDAGVAFDATRA